MKKMSTKQAYGSLRKNLLDLGHERYLQKCHTVVQVGFAVWLAFLGGMAAYIIEGNHDVTDAIILATAVGTAVIFTLTGIFYRISKNKRYEIIREIKKLNIKDDGA